MSAMGLNTEGEGSAMAFLRRGYKVRLGLPAVLCCAVLFARCLLVIFQPVRGVGVGGEVGGWTGAQHGAAPVWRRLMACRLPACLPLLFLPALHRRRPGGRMTWTRRTRLTGAPEHLLPCCLACWMKSPGDTSVCARCRRQPSAHVVAAPPLTAPFPFLLGFHTRHFSDDFLAPHLPPAPAFILWPSPSLLTPAPLAQSTGHFIL